MQIEEYDAPGELAAIEADRWTWVAILSAACEPGFLTDWYFAVLDRYGNPNLLHVYVEPGRDGRIVVFAADGPHPDPGAHSEPPERGECHEAILAFCRGLGGPREVVAG